jgi:hypothetical protein
MRIQFGLEIGCHVHLGVGRPVWSQPSSIRHRACPIILWLLIWCRHAGRIIVTPSEPPVARVGVLVQWPTAASLTLFEAPGAPLAAA